MNQSKSDYLFVYSSLREGFRKEEYDYVHQYFKLVCKGKVEGLMGNDGKNQVAIPSENSFIYGELYKINHEDEFSFAIGQLDDYEGVKPEADETALYKRALTIVFTEDGKEIVSWIYWYNGKIKRDEDVIKNEAGN
jgi:gamma-glutamylcyclotransferase (GGCT)/AIG2-like uncharacterized protein YtfP